MQIRYENSGSVPRLTKIVCTIGPASWKPEQLEQLARKGMNVARINMSHGDRKGQESLVRKLKTLNEQLVFPVAVLVDTNGCEIRTGDVVDPISVKAGAEMLFAPSSMEGKISGKDVIFVNYDGFAQDVRATKEILIDNGELSFQILQINLDGTVRARAMQDGRIGARRHVNLPGADIQLPSITEKDWDDIAFAADHEADFVALSFIRNAEEIASVREYLAKRGSAMQLIAKIETRQAVTNLESIVDASDGVMVARGDLGAEVPFEHLPVIQDEIVRRCIGLGKPVIVATHMLESMIAHPIPTRAEVTDVAHAAMTYTDATMLSGETAGGNHPTLAVDAMDRILRATEQQVAVNAADFRGTVHGTLDAQAQAAVSFGRSSGADALLVLTRSGTTARLVSKFRPNVPIIAVTPDEKVQRRLQLTYGVMPLLMPFGEPEATAQSALLLAESKGLVHKGQKVVLITDAQTTGKNVSTVQMRSI